MSMKTNNGRLKGYSLKAPGKEEAIVALSRIMLPEQAEELWESACTTHNILSSTGNIDELENIFKELSENQGTVGVIGKSLLVRVNSYKLLKRKENAK